MTTVDPTAQAPFRQSYPIDFHLYNDDEQEVLNITDDPAGQNLHLEVSNASGQNINLLVPSNTTASADNYHFALRFRPGTLSLPFQTYASFAASALSKPQPQMNLVQAFQRFVTPSPQGALPGAIQAFVAATTPAPQSAQPTTVSSAIQAFAVDTASTLQGFLQQQGWNLGYQQEPDGTVIVYFLSTQAQTLAPGAKVAITLPHVSASGAEGARGTRVELLYQQLTFGNDPTPFSGHRQIYLSIVNQRGQKQIPLHVSFAGFNSILNDGKTLNTLTLRITNVLKDKPIALNPAGSSASSKFILSFDIQDNNQEDWTLGTASAVGAIVIAADANWSVTPPTGQEESPEWIVTPLATKTLLAADEALQLTLNNIITSSSGQTNLYVRYENIPGYWDGQFVVTIEKTPLLYRGSNVGIGTTHPVAALTISNPGQSISTQQPSHLQLRREASETTGDKLLFLELYQDENPQPTVPPVYPIIRFHHHNRFWERIEGRDDGIHFKVGDLTSDGDTDIFAGNGHFSGNVSGSNGTFSGNISAGNGRFSGNVGIGPGMLNLNPTAALTVSAPGQTRSFQQPQLSHLQLYREASETGGGPVLFLELYQNATEGSQVGNVFPCIRFQQNRQGSQRIEAQPITNSIHFKVGNLARDDYIDIFALNIHAIGSISAPTKHFLIDHPSKPDHNLIHACLEGPEAGVYYRGEAQLEHGRTTIHLPDYFEALTRKEGRTVVLTPKGREPFLLSYEDIVDGAFKVYGTSSDGVFSWEVKAVRADVGRLEVEIRKS